MRTFRRIAGFCALAMVGAGLAIGVGFSIAPPRRCPADGRPVSEPREHAVEEPTPSPDHWVSLSQPLLRATDGVAPRPTLSAPLSPLPAEPYLARTQQFIPEMDKPRLEEIQQYVRRQLDSEPDPPASDITPPVSARGEKQQTPAGAAEPQPEAPVSKARIDEEGDGRLTIHIQDAEIREVLDLLGEEGNLNILAGHSVQGKVSATLRGVDIAGALDAILKSTGLVARREGKFIFVGTPADFDSLEQAMDKVATRVYRPNYVTAAELQALIQPLLTETVGVVSVSSAAEMGIETDDTKAGGDKFAGGDVVVVRDYRAVLAQIDQVVEEIDVRPMQVAIEAMILSVKLDDKYQFGVNFELLRDKNNVKLGWGTPPGSLGEVSFEKGGLKFGFLDSSLSTFLSALESIGDTNVIATPRVMVLNKHRAEIQIGEEKGYVSLTTTETSSTQSVEFLKLGAQLRLRPFISSDGLIRMEIHPELSDGSVDTSSGFTLPNKEVTQVTTNIMVRDGCTVVIGGLMREQLSNTTSQVPLLGSLPLVGVAFRNKQETTERRELLVLITPRIVYEPETCREGDQAACEFHRRQAVYADKMSPLGKRSVARKYFRLAQNAWATGDRERALRFIELSVHFDPLNRAAIDLRSDIWLGRQHGEHTLGAGATAGPPLSPMDGETLPPWLLDDLEQEPVPPMPPLHPLDPGQPGSHTDVVRPRRLQ
jgi:type IV pilus assembly protein PilQ